MDNVAIKMTIKMISSFNFNFSVFQIHNSYEGNKFTDDTSAARLQKICEMDS